MPDSIEDRIRQGRRLLNPQAVPPPSAPPAVRYEKDIPVGEDGLRPYERGPAPPYVADNDPYGDIIKNNTQGQRSFTELMRGAQIEGASGDGGRPVRWSEKSPPPARAATSRAVGDQVARDILPGEEQVTTRDVLRSLSPTEQSSLQAKFDASGHSGSMGYDDWLSENFGDLPPDQRSSAMRTASGSTPRINLGSDPSLPAGVNSPLADARRASGMPLPEGREPKQYSKEQSRTMSRNVHNPEVPMGRFGGTFTLNADGAMSSRAPAPDAMQQAAAIAADQGEGSPSHVLALAQSYGIDVHKYGDDMDMLTADTLREHKRQSELAAKYDTIPTGSNAFRFTPNAAMKDRVDTMDRERLARSIGNRYSGMLSPEQEMAIDAAAASPDGANQLRALNSQLRRVRERNSAQAVRARANNYNMTQDLRNPNLAPGMGVRSLIEAVQSGNPELTAVAYDVYGNPTAATQSRQLAAMQAQAAAAAQDSVADRAHEVEIAKIGASKDALPDPLADQQQREMARIRAIENPTERLDALKAYVDGAHKDWPAEQKAAQVQELMASIQARASADPMSDQFVRQHLDSMRGNKPMFMLYATQELKLTPQQAEALYESGTKPTTARQWGQAAGAAIPNAGAAALNWGRGFAGGVVSGASGGK